MKKKKTRKPGRTGLLLGVVGEAVYCRQKRAEAKASGRVRVNMILSWATQRVRRRGEGRTRRV